ncbi:MAG: hypothetical protein NTV06_00645 [candidate division Zixibacteria bacterium]|nr:hypothetical protein [candidate division Zixibacteria bacterium]
MKRLFLCVFLLVLMAVGYPIMANGISTDRKHIAISAGLAFPGTGSNIYETKALPPQFDWSVGYYIVPRFSLGWRGYLSNVSGKGKTRFLWGMGPQLNFIAAESNKTQIYFGMAGLYLDPPDNDPYDHYSFGISLEASMGVTNMVSRTIGIYGGVSFQMIGFSSKTYRYSGGGGYWLNLSIGITKFIF